MLYVLPPPRAPNPPSPWESILCASGTGNATPWGDVKQTAKRPPSRAKVQNLKLRSKTDDSSGAVLLDEDDSAKASKSLSECYFAGKGSALVLPPHERLRPSRRPSVQGPDIQQHLQSMFYLLRPEETLKMAVKLESGHLGRTRYLVVVCWPGRAAEEACLLGIDCNERTTVGLVLRVLADTAITLDGDGGFSVSVCGRHHIFKPVSVQAMWSALQTLHKVSSKAREQNYFQGGPTHEWVNYYEQHIESDRSCLNEWHAMDSLESRRPPSPDSVRTKPRERDETEQVIRSTLKEIMMSVDLDEVTSKYIRNRLEEELDMDLGEFKSFIDQEMIVILGQMDAPTEIFEHVYLGSEWNASNFEELQKNGVGHILNVTREIDNFFPGMFDYLNIRVYDDEKTDLLKYWDNTFKYISKAKKEGSKVLVHCKMGVSRSASVVIAYAMKAYNWDFEKALKHVKGKRNCIKPNNSFIAQLETYQGILDAMKNKEKLFLQRSKSETNLKSPELVNKNEKRVLATSEPNSVVQSHERDQVVQNDLSGHDLRHIGARPKSWSPDYHMEQTLLLERGTAPVFLSLENLSKDITEDTMPMNANTSPDVRRKSSSCPSENARNVLMPLNNGQSYSVSPNQIVHICKKRSETVKPSIKHRINELELYSSGSLSKKPAKDKKSLVLNLTTQFESGKSKAGSSTVPDANMSSEKAEVKNDEGPVHSHAKLVPQMLTAKLLKKEIWDPGEKKSTVLLNNTVDIPSCENCDSSKLLTNDNIVWTSSTVVKQSVPLINNIETSVENNKLDLQCEDNVKKTVPEVFYTKTLLGVIGSNSDKVVPTTRKEDDLFSNQLDKVFDREERKQQRNSIVINSTVVPTPVPITETSSEEVVRECPSRQSSWSSYDSAVVLGYQGESRDAPSRHSSWGSGDTRTVPSRNSSWGSYDMKPTGHLLPPGSELFESTSSGLFPYDRDEIPWYPGTVRRTKQKLEAPKETEKRVCTGVDATLTTIPLLDVQPHKSPSTETLTSDYSVSVLSENEAPVEAYNTGLLHHRSSPDLCESKIDNQRVTSVIDQPFQLSRAISKEIDIISDSDKYFNCHVRSGSRLSVSAPERSVDRVPFSSCSASNVSSVGKGGDARTATPLRESSSATVIYTAQCSSVKKHKNYLENLHKETEFVSKRTFPPDSTHSESENNSTSGIVKSLKKEFEAKTGTKLEQVTAFGDSLNAEGDFNTRLKPKGTSLPSSPISNTYMDYKSAPEENPELIEDVSVKELVGKYEVVGTNNKSYNTAQETPVIKPRCMFDNKLFSNNQHKNIRYSCIEVLSGTSDKSPMLISASSIFEANEPELNKAAAMCSGGPLPSVVMATVVKAASKKQKHIKKDSHARLSMPRNNNPVYNTM